MKTTTRAPKSERHYNTCDRCLVFPTLANLAKLRESTGEESDSFYWLPCSSRLPLKSVKVDGDIDRVAVLWFEDVCISHHHHEVHLGRNRVDRAGRTLQQRLGALQEAVKQAGNYVPPEYKRGLEGLASSLATLLELEISVTLVNAASPTEALSDLLEDLKTSGACQGRGTGSRYLAARICHIWSHAEEPNFLFLARSVSQPGRACFKDFKSPGMEIDPPLFRRLWGGTISPRMSDETRTHLLAQRFDRYTKPSRSSKTAAKS